MKEEESRLLKILLMCRRDASLLMAEGHPDSWDYPLALLWNESRIAQQRINGVLATESLLIYEAIAAVYTGKLDTLKESIRSLRNGNE